MNLIFPLRMTVGVFFIELNLIAIDAVIDVITGFDCNQWTLQSLIQIDLTIDDQISFIDRW